MLKSKSQYWYMDLIMAITIFTLILIVAFRYVSEELSTAEDRDIVREANKLSEVLMTPGLPRNWSSDYVVVVGLVEEDQTLNLTKVQEFSNMTNEDYNSIRQIMGVRTNFIVYFEKVNGTLLNLTDQSYIGQAGETPQTVKNKDPKEIVTLTRYPVHRHDDIAEIIAMKVMLWNLK